MTKRQEEEMIEQSFRFVGIPKRKQKQIFKILNCCKEIRDTAYPMNNSLITELELVEFSATKEKDMISVSGALLLIDGEEKENRCFEAYIMENDDETRVYMDITRLCVIDEPKFIRTSEIINIKEDNIEVITKYEQGESCDEKAFSYVLPKQDNEEEMRHEKLMQISSLC